MKSEMTIELFGVKIVNEYKKKITERVFEMIRDDLRMNEEYQCLIEEHGEKEVNRRLTIFISYYFGIE